MSVSSMAARAQSNFLWSFATLGERMGAACLEALATQAQKQLPQFTAQNLANMMWAFAKLSYTPDKELLQSCEAHAVSTARAFSPQDLVRCCLLQLSSNVFAGLCLFVKLRLRHDLHAGICILNLISEDASHDLVHEIPRQRGCCRPFFHGHMRRWASA